MNTTYPINLSDVEWACMQRHLPPGTHSLHDILDTVFYVLRTSCPWHWLPMALSAEQLPAVANYRGKGLAEWRWQQGGGWVLEVVVRTLGMRRFAVLPKRWIVERTFGWLSRNRRMSKDYERTDQTSEALIEVAALRLVLCRPVRHRACTA